MGFSVAIASAIVLIGLIAFAGGTVVSMLYMLDCLATFTNSSASLRQGVQIDLEVINVTASTVHFYVKNTGSNTIFLKNQTFNWNSVVVAYNCSGWRSYLIEDYFVSEIKVQGSNVSFSLSTHKFINPGEEAQIDASLPGGAPLIPSNEPVFIVFTSHYGVSASKETVRT